MPVPWVLIAQAAATAYGAYASNEASKAQGKGAGRGIAEQQRQFNTALNMLEPQRRLGYQALGDLSALYGYSTPGYQPVNQLLYGQPTGAAPAGAQGTMPKWMDPLNVMGNPRRMAGAAIGFTGDPVLGAAIGLSGGDKEPYNARIDPVTGTVDVKGAGPKKDALYTNYLQTGEWTGGKGGRGKKVRSAIDALRSQGWSYGEGGGQWEGAIPAQPAGQPGNMSRFFTSPDYTFRRDEGQRDIGNTFAARGGAASGNALRALTDFNQNLASGEYNNYVNRLLQMAGLGSAATSQGVNVGQATANNVANLMQAQGDARASGYLGVANTLASGVNSGLNYGLWNRYLAQNTQQAPQPAPVYSQYGPWAVGYRFPG